MAATFDPRPWTPPRAPALEGPYARNDLLASSELIPTGGVGPEDPAVADGGTIYTGTADGAILAIRRHGAVDHLAETGGRPLGVEIGPDGRLVVCDADRGLLRIGPSGAIEELATGYEGEPFIFTNNATVGDEGTVYFTVSSRRYSIHRYVDDLLEHSGTGRLYAYRPDGAVELLVDGLQFANGVAMAPDGASLFVAETGMYRICRYHVSGPKAGTYEPFVENLPGFPDNLSFGGGVLWVPLASPRQPLVDVMLPRPWLRKIAYRLPDSLKPKPVRHGIVLGFDLDGTVVHNLQDTTGKVAVTTGVRWVDGRIVIGSLTEPHLAVYDLG